MPLTLRGLLDLVVKLPVSDDAGLELVRHLAELLLHGRGQVGWEGDGEGDGEGDEVVARRQLRARVDINLLDRWSGLNVRKEITLK